MNCCGGPGDAKQPPGVTSPAAPSRGGPPAAAAAHVDPAAAGAGAAARRGEKMAGEGIDEDRESRQMAVYGRAAMLKMSKSRVLISGLNGVGAETAKNVILANVKEVILHDEPEAVVTLADLGGNFYLGEKDVGKHRAEACRATFQELNPSCAVSALKEPLTPEYVRAARLDVVVMCAGGLEKAAGIDAACRETVLSHQEQSTMMVDEGAQGPVVGMQPLKWTPTTCFVYTVAHGVFGGLFCDFGPTFVVSDKTGEPTKTGIVGAVSKGEEGAKGDKGKGTVKFVIEEDIDFDEGEYVEFTELQGLEALNSTPDDPKLVKMVDVYLGKHMIHTPLLASVPGEYALGGIATQRKVPKRLSFRSLAECLADPGELQDIDMSKQSPKAKAFDESVLAYFGQPVFNTKFGRSGLVLLGLRAIDKVGVDAAKGPGGAELVAKAAAEINSAAAEALRVEEMDGDRAASLGKLAHGAGAVLNPMSAILGGIAGQEVIKACSFKFHPTHQWFVFDAEECLPAALPPPAAAAGSRYDAQLQVFGAEFQARLAALRVFLVGSGALGCEFMKNFALMGVASGAEGLVTVTDDDIIEKSNLSRQFLFRNHNVGKSKSLSAADAVKVMNPAFRVKPREDRVAPNTEDIFNDDFWDGLNVVTNALDNVKARLYVDEKCVFFNKPLLESGTLGPKCNQQSVIPHYTENYGAQKDPDEKTAPMCALHNFPHNIDMCLALARSEFIGNFNTVAEDVNNFAKAGGKAWVQKQEASGENKGTIKDKLCGSKDINCAMAGGMMDVLVTERPQSFDDCVAWARRKYNSYFVDRIRLLVYNFPEDSKNQSGKPFWSPPKRFPHSLAFDPANEGAMAFIIAASNLRAKLFNIGEEHRDPAYFAKVLAKVKVPEFQLYKAKIAAEEEEEEGGAKEAAGGGEAAAPADDDVDAQIAQAEAAISKALGDAPLKGELLQNEFEKDDDSNFHIAFIQAFANLRAENYGIKGVDFLQAKLKAGRIIPAIATATAVATGFVCLELYKVVGERANSSYRNTFCNLALPIFSQSEPQEAAKTTSGKHFDEAMYMDVEEIAIPDPQTCWSNIIIPDAAKMTPNGTKAWMKEKYDADLNGYLLQYPDPDKPGVSKASSNPLQDKWDQPWVEVLAGYGLDVVGRKYVEIHNGGDRNLEVTKGEDDSDVKFCRIVLQVR